MNRLAITLALMALCSAGFAASKASPEDEQAVRKTIAGYGTAEDMRDAAAVGPAWTENAVYVTESGERVQGREAIVKRLKEYKAKHPGDHVRLTVENIRFPTDGVAQVEGDAEVRGPEGPPEINPYVAIVVKRGGRWLLDSVHDLSASSDEDDQPTAERLKALDWMVGEWQQSSGGITTQASCRWDKNGNFLLWDYTTKAGDQEAMTVTQRIGWDPHTGQFRSWIFDSEGGYAEGQWEKDEGAWEIRQTGVLPDGGTASATAVLSPDGRNGFQWVLTNRRVGGEKLPDVKVRFTRMGVAKATVGRK